MAIASVAVRRGAHRISKKIAQGDIQTNMKHHQNDRSCPAIGQYAVEFGCKMKECLQAWPIAGESPRPKKE
jgi:hypothetical protein